MASEKQCQPTARTQLLLGLLIVFVDAFALMSAFACSFWIIYLAYEAKGILMAILVLPFLALCYIPGPAATFAIAATILHFYSHVLGLWLPVISYVFAIITWFIAPMRVRLLRYELHCKYRDHRIAAGAKQEDTGLDRAED